MTQVVSILTRGAHVVRRRPARSLQLALLAAAVAGGVVLATQRSESPSAPSAPTAAAATVPALRDPSLPDASQSLSGTDRAADAWVPTF
jgi:hypothetical protein|nr:hypothetical protein [Caldimonas sp.]